MYKTIKGTDDIIGCKMEEFLYLRDYFENKMKSYNIKRIETPIIEYEKMYIENIGNSTDIIDNETFVLKNEREGVIVLRPEKTVSVARAIYNNNLINKINNRFFYFSPFFRDENVEEGRKRQFHQFGVEMVGDNSVVRDIELIKLVSDIFLDLGLKDVKLYINTIGCNKCIKKYTSVISDVIQKEKIELCDICKIRLKNNPIRVLDCKDLKCKNNLRVLPKTIDVICSKCRKEFDNLKTILDELEINYTIEKNVVRGMNYYSNLVFEFKDNKGNTLCGGGRYNNLFKNMFDENIPAIGFAIGIERLLITLRDNKLLNFKDKNKDKNVIVCYKNENLLCESIRMAERLRKSGKVVEVFNIKKEEDLDKYINNKEEIKIILIDNINKK